MIIHTQVCKEKQCKKKFRARLNHDLCRIHYRAANGESRPISSREKVVHGYRRSKARRRTAKVKVEVKGKKK